MSLSDGIRTVSLESQVGGHAGVLTTEGGDLLIKPALPRELEFYQKLQSDEKLATLLPYVPKFLGTLTLEGQVDENNGQEDGIAIKPFAEKKDKLPSIAFNAQNISHPFLKPNILDIKLGTVLYDERASPEKVARMIKNAQNTTSFETGIRLTGFQVYDNVTGLAVNTPKSYGKSIKAADLPAGIARFFPIGTESTGSTGGSGGLPASLLRPILKEIRDQIREIRNTFAELELRMVGGSLLIVYEGDWDRAREALNSVDEDKDGEEEEEEDEENNKPGPPCVVKLIDFAHTRVVAGEGPDTGVLLGMDTTLSLLDGRLKAIV